jgi:hypothetical protein
MAVYAVTGDLGSGKSLITVGLMRDYGFAKKRIATNMNINPQNLWPDNNDNMPVRLSDFPSSKELWAMGKGSESPDESTFGCLVLDELGASMNTRDWNDRDRKEIIKFFLHTRKLGWDVYLLVQHIDMLDKQIKNAVVEHLVVCKRLDRVKIPFIGSLLQIAGFSGKFMKLHIASVKYGKSNYAPVVNRWYYTGHGILYPSLFTCYDTRQIFTDDSAPCTLLSSKQLHQWYGEGARSTVGHLINPPKKTLSEPPKLLSRPKHPLVEKIMKLPPEKRIHFFNRFEACGAFNR